jgi:hypothetical protein
MEFMFLSAVQPESLSQSIERRWARWRMTSRKSLAKTMASGSDSPTLKLTWALDPTAFRMAELEARLRIMKLTALMLDPPKPQSLPLLVWMTCPLRGLSRVRNVAHSKTSGILPATALAPDGTTLDSGVARTSAITKEEE